MATNDYERSEGELQDKYRWGSIPRYMRGGVTRYIEFHIPPGNFLTAVISNDLKEACARADETNQRLLFDYVQFFWNQAPSACWGSPAKMAEWLKERVVDQ
jgi:hypothetical protein